MSNVEGSFYVVADPSQEDANGNAIYHYVPAKYDIELGSPIFDFNWGETFVGDNGTTSILNGDNPYYAVYDTSSAPLPGRMMQTQVRSSG